MESTRGSSDVSLESTDGSLDTRVTIDASTRDSSDVSLETQV